MTYWLRRKHELQYPVIERCVNGRRAAKVLHTSERERFSRELAFERLQRRRGVRGRDAVGIAGVHLDQLAGLRVARDPAQATGPDRRKTGEQQTGQCNPKRRVHI